MSPWAVDDFPEALAIKVELLPWLFPVHMVSGGLALVLGPLAFVLRRRRVHRLAGRIAAADVAVAGVTAFPVALVAPVTWASALGFTAQGATWLALLTAAIVFIRRGDTRAHAVCMVLMLATMSGAVFFRVALALWAIFAHGRHFELAYAIDAWAAWTVPLALTAWALRRFGTGWLIRAR